MTDEVTTEGQESLETTETQAAPGSDAGGDVAGASAPDQSGTLEGGDASGSEEPTSAEIDLAALRKALAGDDEGLLKDLNRYRSASAIGKAIRDAKAAAKQKQGPFTLKDDASEEEVAEYRKAYGIPDDANDYPVQWREGYEPSEVDQELLGSFKNYLHERNADPKAAAAAMEWYQDLSQQIQQDRDAAMAKASKETQEVLRGEYGSEYDGNIRAANELLRTRMGEDGHKALMEWRGEDGVRLQDNPDFVRMMVDLGVDYYGANTIVHGDVETTTKTLEDRKAELLELRKTDPQKYKSDAIQSEITKIYKQLDKLSSRK